VSPVKNNGIGKSDGTNHKFVTGRAGKGPGGMPPFNFSTVPIATVLRTRRGKHYQIVTEILSDLEQLDNGSAIQVPLKNLKSTKLENLRAALNRATRSRNMSVSTSADEENLYVWVNSR